MLGLLVHRGLKATQEHRALRAKMVRRVPEA